MERGAMTGDTIGLATENLDGEALLRPVMVDEGAGSGDRHHSEEIRSYAREQVSRLPARGSVVDKSRELSRSATVSGWRRRASRDCNTNLEEHHGPSLPEVTNEKVDE
jgi:hypothetical protein